MLFLRFSNTKYFMHVHTYVHTHTCACVHFEEMYFLCNWTAEAVSK